MRLDAAWHVWFLVALPVMIDGVLAVSALCGCCHHLLLYFLVCPIFLVPSVCDITWFLFAFFFLFIITWCMCCGDYGFCLVGGLILLFMYHHLFVYSLWSL